MDNSSKNRRVNCLWILISLFAISSSTMAASQINTNVALTQKQLNEFFENGLIVIPEFFNKQEVSQTLESATRLQMAAENLAKEQTGKIMYKGTQIVLEKVGDKNELLRVVWGGAAEPELLKLARQEKLLVPVGQILGSDKADQLNNQLHYKFPNGGINLTFYQDIRNRKNFDKDWKDLNGKGSFVLTVIALDPMNVENGTIYYVPKSHMRGDLMLDKIADKAALRKVAQLDKAVPLLLSPGDLVVWHPYLIHGSDPNKFSTQRRIFINGFSYPGANTKPYPGDGSAQTINLK